MYMASKAQKKRNLYNFQHMLHTQPTTQMEFLSKIIILKAKSRDQEISLAGTVIFVIEL